MGRDLSVRPGDVLSNLIRRPLPRRLVLVFVPVRTRAVAVARARARSRPENGPTVEVGVSKTNDFASGHSTAVSVAVASVPVDRRADTTPAAAEIPARTSAVTVKAWSTPAAVPLSPPVTVKIAPVRARPIPVPMPRVMLRTPDAIPAWCAGAAPMIEALLGEVKSPIPTPTAARAARSPASAVGRPP